MKKWHKWAIGLFVAFYILTNPRNAAGTVNAILGKLGEWGNALATFVGALGG